MPPFLGFFPSLLGVWGCLVVVWFWSLPVTLEALRVDKDDDVLGEDVRTVSVDFAAVLVVPAASFGLAMVSVASIVIRVRCSQLGTRMNDGKHNERLEV